MADIEKRIKKASRKLEMLLLEQQVARHDDAVALAERYRRECSDMDVERNDFKRQCIHLRDEMRKIKELTLISSHGPWVPAELASNLLAIQRIVLPNIGESKVG